jgi:hypothetical protein
VSTKVLLPPGCGGFKAADGTPYTAKPGTFVRVEDKHLGALESQDYVSAGLVAARERFFTARKGDGRWCGACKRLWNRWNKTCGKCGAETAPEGEMPRDLPAGPWQP